MAQQMSGTVRAQPASEWPHTIRMVTGAALAIILVLIAAITVKAANGETDAGADLSAIQLVQVYAESCFYAITAIGIAFAIYIGTRKPD